MHNICSAFQRMSDNIKIYACGKSAMWPTCSRQDMFTGSLTLDTMSKHLEILFGTEDCAKYFGGKFSIALNLHETFWRWHWAIMQCSQCVRDHYIMALLTLEGRKAWPQDQQRARARRRSSVPWGDIFEFDWYQYVHIYIYHDLLVQIFPWTWLGCAWSC